MMKRTILLIQLLCGFSILCYAKGNLELFGGVPLTWEKGKALGYDTDTQMTSISFGFGGIIPINNRISFGVWDEIILPQKIETTVANKKVSIGRSDYETLMGMSFLVGPVFYLYSGMEDRLKIPLNVGLRWMWLTASTESSVIFGNVFGLGAGIGAEFHATERVNIFGRLTGIYDFYSISSITVSGYYGTSTVTASGFASSFGFTPHIGVGFSF